MPPCPTGGGTAAAVGGLREIVAEAPGTLFRPADPADLAGRVAALLERTDLEEAGRRARARVAPRSWPRPAAPTPAPPRLRREAR